MSQTPFNTFQKKQRYRKLQLITNIQKKDLKKRSISYNLKIQNDTHNPQGEKSREKQKINFSHSAKKSSYCRKYLNQSIQDKLTCDDFIKFKEKINKVRFIEHGNNVFQKQRENKRKKQLRKDFQTTLQINTFGQKQKEKENIQNHDYYQPPVLVFQRNTQEKDKEKVQSITDIAQKRKLSLDFDLQIQGNKKSIRVKDVPNHHHQKIIHKKRNMVLQGVQQADGSWTPDARPDTNISYNFQPKPQKQKQTQTLRPPCTFFKRFKQKHYPKDDPQKQDQTILINKIKYNLDKLQQIPTQYHQFQRSNTGDNYRTHDTTYQIRKQIRSSYNTNQSKKRQLGINYQPRNRKCKNNVCFVNDINAWNVKNGNQEGDGLEDDSPFF